MLHMKLFTFLSFFFVVTLGFNDNNKRVLVLLENVGIKESHSIYFKLLRENGFQLTYKLADDTSLTLTKYGEYLYDNLIIFSPSVIDFGGNVTNKAIIDFIDAGGNVLITASSDINEPIKEIAGECGLEFGEEKSFVLDRFNIDINDDGKNNLLVVDTDNLINNKIITGNSKNGNPFLFRGIGMSIDVDNPLITNILSASIFSYTANPDEKIIEYPNSIGKKTSLIASLQARNNARVLFVGSLEFFSNEFFEASIDNGSKKIKSGNEDLCLSLTKWTFKETGVLRVANIAHFKVQDKSQPPYTIKDDIVYQIEIEEYSNGKWQSFEAKDVQLEFIRLDPFVRINLSKKNNKFEALFKIPDVYGIFKFVVDYNRIGYTHLFTSTQVSVRPLQHTEYERFIPAAYPYYISAFSMIACVYIFSFIMLYFKD